MPDPALTLLSTTAQSDKEFAAKSPIARFRIEHAAKPTNRPDSNRRLSAMVAAPLGMGLLVLGHLYFALNDPEARWGMRTGRVSARWARREHAAWAEEVEPGTDSPPPADDAVQ